MRDSTAATGTPARRPGHYSTGRIPSFLDSIARAPGPQPRTRVARPPLGRAPTPPRAPGSRPRPHPPRPPPRMRRRRRPGGLAGRRTSRRPMDARPRDPRARWARPTRTTARPHSRRPRYPGISPSSRPDAASCTWTSPSPAVRTVLSAEVSSDLPAKSRRNSSKSRR